MHIQLNFQANTVFELPHLTLDLKIIVSITLYELSYSLHSKPIVAIISINISELKFEFVFIIPSTGILNLTSRLIDHHFDLQR